MRIIIESNESQERNTIVEVHTQPETVNAEDGGTPAPEFLQTLEPGFTLPVAQEGVNAGTPPEWLVEAVRNMHQTVNEEPDAARDGGGAGE